MLSLIPFTTAWVGENHFTKSPVALYGLNLLLCAITFTILERVAIKYEGVDSTIGKAIKSSAKEYASSLIYIIGITLSFWFPTISMLCYSIVALIWLIPDKRIENLLK